MYNIVEICDTVGLCAIYFVFLYIATIMTNLCEFTNRSEINKTEGNFEVFTTTQARLLAAEQGKLNNDKSL